MNSSFTSNATRYQNSSSGNSYPSLKNYGASYSRHLSSRDLSSATRTNLGYQSPVNSSGNTYNSSTTTTKSYRSCSTSSSSYGYSGATNSSPTVTTLIARASPSTRSPAQPLTQTLVPHHQSTAQSTLQSSYETQIADNADKKQQSVLGSALLNARQGPRIDQGRVGLSNLGNTCYMNSMLQCLSHTRLLLDLALTDGGDADAGGFTGGRVAGVYRRLMQDLWSPDASSAVRPSDLKASMGRFASRFAGYGQQDSQEFLRYLLEALHEDTNRVPRDKRPKLPPVNYEELDKMSDSAKADALWERYRQMENSPIADMFVGQLKSTLECSQCKQKSTTFDPFWDLALPIPLRDGIGRGKTSLSDCLQQFTSAEILDKEEMPVCASCKARRLCTKSFSLYRLPKVLVIHLMRFSGERFKTKLNTLVDYPFDLDLTEFIDPGSGSRTSGTARYTLYAVSEHSGTPYGGHYTAAVRHAYSTSSQPCWLAFNDSRVTSISADSAVSSQGYVLFYAASGSAL